jgi:hypothetical protein
MNYSIVNRFDQGGGVVEVHESDSTPYNKSQWRTLHIGSARDKHPGSATKHSRNTHTLNDPAQTGSYPSKNYYSRKNPNNKEKGVRQYPTGYHEISQQPLLESLTVNHSQGDIYHSNDAESAVPSYMKDVGAVAHVTNPTQEKLNITNYLKEEGISPLDYNDLRDIYALNYSIPNFMTLAKVAKQNFMHSITEATHLI